VDLDRFKPQEDDPERRRKVRAAYGIPSHALLLCFVGRLARDKGIEILAAAWQELAAEVPDLHLLSCGGCDCTDPVPAGALNALRSHSRVHMMEESVTDMPSIYAAADMVVLPTFREGLPQVVVEASAMQLPIVGSRVSGMVDAVEDGVTGLLVPPGDPTALASAIRRLIEDQALRHRLGIAGRQFVSARFSDTRVNNIYLAEYLGLVGAAQVPGTARALRGGTA
jgi:glycosyltransferase involved in cell wall biosynthesis